MIRGTFPTVLFLTINVFTLTGVTSIHGVDYMIQLLKQHGSPEDKVVLLVLGPLTTVAEALNKAPEIEPLIREIVWMGGALNTSGNVAYVGHDGSAEWNGNNSSLNDTFLAFWDPYAVDRVWKSSIPIILTPLDITNNVPLTPQFLKILAKQRSYPLSDFAGNCYALVAVQAYYFWDVLCTAYVGKPEYFTVRFDP